MRLQTSPRCFDEPSSRLTSPRDDAVTQIVDFGELNLDICEVSQIVLLLYRRLLCNCLGQCIALKVESSDRDIELSFCRRS
jgi:hypothetical protein